MTKLKWLKVFSRSAWTLLSIFFAILTAVVVVGGSIAQANAGALNGALGLNPYKKYELASEVATDTEYYKSEYYKADVTYHHAAMRANSDAVAAAAAVEGSVLLWNDNVAGGKALPLAEGSNVTLFGNASAPVVDQWKRRGWIFNGEGSGMMWEKVAITEQNLRTALSNRGINVNATVHNRYSALDSGIMNGRHIAQLSNSRYRIDSGEAPYSAVSAQVDASIAGYGDAAVMMISRYAGEYKDIAYGSAYVNSSDDGVLDDPGNLLSLTDDERDMLSNIKALKDQGKVKRIILLLNSANAMNFDRLISDDYDIDACVWMGLGGSASYVQIAEVLSGRGENVLSGRMPDILAKNIRSAPAFLNYGDFTFSGVNADTGLPDYSIQGSNNEDSWNTKYLAYQEGVYVGYRYYETRYEDAVMGTGGADSSKGVVAGGTGAWDYGAEVAFPFGHGLSYAEFKQSEFAVTETADAYEVSVKVENTGSVANGTYYDGKEVVQVYLQKPYTQYDKDNGIEKPAVELAGYAKTRRLAPSKNPGEEPGDSETVTVKIPKESFKVYDAYNAGTYILEGGDYYLSVGTSSHDALNNILASKGYDETDGMDYNGDAGFAELIEIKDSDIIANDDGVDSTTYAVSDATGAEIVNQFSDADINLYAGTEGQEMTYLSRKDWDGTYPTAPVGLSLADTSDEAVKRFIADMQYGKQVEADPADKMPVYNRITSSLGQLVLLDMKDLEYDDPMWEDLLNQMTRDEQLLLVTNGLKAYVGAESVAAPGGVGNDGPAGIKVKNPVLDSQMNFPAASVIAATFNDELIGEVGNAYGLECLHAGVNIAYAPGANMHRTAGAGRNWEYYSEDPFLSGKAMEYQVRGIQSRGVVVLTKHMLLNDQESFRHGVATFANEQTIREIYLAPFEIAVRNAAMNGVMTSFNRIGCTYSGAHKGMIAGVLRGEWGFKGIVESDAAANVGRNNEGNGGINGGVAHVTSYNIQAEGFLAGQDIWMLGGCPTFLEGNGYRSNPTVMQALRDATHRILYSKLNSSMVNGMSVNTKIVKVMVWWEKLLVVAEIVVAAVLALCLTMAVLSYVFKIRPVRSKLETAANSGFFTKAKTAVLISCIAAVLVLIMVIGTVVPIVSKTKEPDLGDLGVARPIEEEERETCPVCGLPLEEHFGEEYCGQDKTPYDYEAEEAVPAAGANALEVQNSTSASGGKFVGRLHGNKSATVTFSVHMPEDEIVCLVVSVNRRTVETTFTDDMYTYVNGERFNSAAKVRANGGTVETWTTFSSVNLGCISLNEGENEIQLKVNDETGNAYNLDKITILSLVEPTTPPYICEEICPISGDCISAEYNEPPYDVKAGDGYALSTRFGKAEGLKWTSGGSGGSPKWEGTGNEFIGNLSNNTGAVVSLTVYAEEAGFVNVIAGVTIRAVPNTYYFNDGYSISLNGEEQLHRHVHVQTLGNTANQWSTSVPVNLGIFELEEGENTITFTVTSLQDGASNFHYVIIRSDLAVANTPFA